MLIGKLFFPMFLKAFELDVYNGDEPLPISELLSGLNAIVQMSASNNDDYPDIGAFTTTDRRIWGKTYRKLKRGKSFAFFFYFYRLSINVS